MERATKETSVEVTIDLDGTGKCTADTGIPFLDHMLDVRLPFLCVRPLTAVQLAQSICMKRFLCKSAEFSLCCSKFPPMAFLTSTFGQGGTPGSTITTPMRTWVSRHSAVQYFACHFCAALLWEGPVERHSLVEELDRGCAARRFSLHHSIVNGASCMHLMAACMHAALAMGTALSQALGDRKGIHRFGDFSAPLDEALVHVVLVCVLSPT